MATSYPKINGQKFDFSSVEIDIAGIIYIGVTELSYTHTLEPGILRGTRAEKLGRTRGEYDAEGSVTIYKDTWNEIRNALGDGYLETSFDITATYAEDDEEIQVDKLFGVRITSVETAPSQGTDPITVDLELDIIRIEENGVLPIEGMLR